MRNRNKLTSRQVRAGERYGVMFRDASIEGTARIGSSLAAFESVRVDGMNSQELTRLAPVEYQANVRQVIHLARIDGLRGQASLIATCDVVCGKQWTLGMVTEDRTSQLQIETALRIALDLLADFFDQDRAAEPAQAMMARAA